MRGACERRTRPLHRLRGPSMDEGWREAVAAAVHSAQQTQNQEIKALPQIPTRRIAGTNGRTYGRADTAG